jgi:hypothetical protein
MSACDDPDGRLLFAVRYEGPWERLGYATRAIGPLAAFCERRDAAWQARWAGRDGRPPQRWKRRTGHASP